MFTTQFLQTLSLGAAPTATTGGTNPRQTGLGTQVAEISFDISPGTIELSSKSSDLAIQGSGFFIVEGAAGERLYTRNGLFDINADNELVATTGQRVLGFGMDKNFQLVETQLVSIDIPLGADAVSKPTQEVQIEGFLTPTGDIADAAEIIESNILGNGFVPRPDSTGIGIINSMPPAITGITANVIKKVFLNKSEDVQALIEQLISLAETARRDGLLALEGRLNEIENPFITLGIQMAVDGARPEVIEDIMRTEIDAVATRHRNGKSILDQMGRFAPTFGMIGTLMGLIIMLGNMDDPSSIGGGMAVAFPNGS